MGEATWGQRVTLQGRQNLILSAVTGGSGGGAMAAVWYQLCDGEGRTVGEEGNVRPGDGIPLDTVADLKSLVWRGAAEDGALRRHPS